MDAGEQARCVAHMEAARRVPSAQCCASDTEQSPPVLRSTAAWKAGPTNNQEVPAYPVLSIYTALGADQCHINNQIRAGLMYVTPTWQGRFAKQNCISKPRYD